MTRKRLHVRPRGRPTTVTPEVIEGAAAKRSTKPANEHKQWLDGLTIMERRVEEIVETMCQGRWLSNVSDRLLAKQWKVSPSYVRHLAVEANHVLKRLVWETAESRDGIRAKIIQTLDVIRARGLAKGDAGGLRVALEATQVYARYLGLEPSQQRPSDDDSDEFSDMSPEQLRAYVREDTAPPQLPAASSNGSHGPNGTNGNGSIH